MILFPLQFDSEMDVLAPTKPWTRMQKIGLSAVVLTFTVYTYSYLCDKTAVWYREISIKRQEQLKEKLMAENSKLLKERQHLLLQLKSNSTE